MTDPGRIVGLARVAATVAAALLAAMLAACQPMSMRDPPAGTPNAPAAASAPSLDELRNARYEGIAEAGGPVTLAGGAWEGPPFAPGGASRPRVTLAPDPRLTADLDGDGREEAVVLLAANAGGSGETLYLAVVARRGAGLANIATANIGDRVQVRSARIEGGRILLDVIQAGPSDAMCCPGDLVARSWTLQGGQLREGPPAATGRWSLAALTGSEWVLRAWDRGEAAPAAPEVTLKFDAGRIAGNAGCNGYFASLQPGETPGDLRVGPVGATRRMCDDAAMAVETRFLQQLAGVQQLRFLATRLALAYDSEGASGVMLFERR